MMKQEYSGNIYKFDLDFALGSAYAELLDFTDIRDFDGILVQVFEGLLNIDNENVSSIKSCEILFGPVPINRYPNLKGRYAWKLIGKSEDYNKETLFFKSLRGIINKDHNWMNLGPWFKTNPFDEMPVHLESDYENVRRLETLILNHPEMVKIKVTIIYLIRQGLNIQEYYDLNEIGNRNMYIQVVNTYFDKERAEELLRVLENNESIGTG